MKRHQIHTKKGWKGHGEKSYRRKAGTNIRIKHYFNNHLTRSERFSFFLDNIPNCVLKMHEKSLLSYADIKRCCHG